MKRERKAVGLAWLAAGWHRVEWHWPVVVLLTRISPSRGLDVHDNLRGSLKAVVDELAARLGVDDRDERVAWRYGQERGPWGVRVELCPSCARKEGA